MYPRRRAPLKRRVVRRKRVYRKRMLKSRQSIHGVKKFVFSFKYQDIVSALNGTNPDGYTRTPLRVSLAQLPALTSLSNLYRQIAITGAKFEYRTINNSPNSVTGAQILMVEDKDTFGTPSVNFMLSQDNCRKLIASRNAKMYVRRPRPNLYQQDAGGTPIKVIGGSKFIHWLSPNVEGDANLPHLCGQFAVSDLIAGATAAQPQGELWCKLYVICKEQAVSGI